MYYPQPQIFQVLFLRLRLHACFNKPATLLVLDQLPYTGLAVALLHGLILKASR